MTTYEKYRRLHIDLAPLGVARGAEETPYFCTPRGAKMIGGAGVDGIHYCFVRGFGEMVFAVSPMNTPGNYVHPLAENFSDFLRLLLACGGADALEQAWGWDQAQFDAYLQSYPPGAEQQAVLDAIAEGLALTPMAQPFVYLQALQKGFDYSRLKFSPGYDIFAPAEPALPEWAVYFDGNFGGHNRREKPGEEIPVGKQFLWQDEVWHIPSIYVCGKGLVVDFCKQIPAASIQAFMNKWHLSPENDGSDFTDEQRMLADAENPMSMAISPEVILNGKRLNHARGCGLSWNPCLSEDNSPEARGMIAHYGFDPAYGWAVRRAAFAWATKRKPRIKTLDIRLQQDLIAVPGIRFQVSAPGDQVTFIHPLTGLQHMLTVQAYERQELSQEHFADPDWVYPTHFVAMSYTLAPDLPEGRFWVADCERSDDARRKHDDTSGYHCVGFAVFYSKDDLPAVAFGGDGQGRLNTTSSAFHFEPAGEVTWRMVFYERTREDISVNVL